MSNAVVYGKLTGKIKFAKIGTLNKNIIDEIFPDVPISEAIEFSPKTLKEDGQYFYIDLSENLDIINPFFKIINSSGSYNPINKDQIPKLDGIYVSSPNPDYLPNLKFQRIWQKYYFKKSYIINCDSDCTLIENKEFIKLGNVTDAFFDGKTNRLYFKKFSQITKLFDQISIFYREAQAEDIEFFKKIKTLQVEVPNELIGVKYGRKVAHLIDEKVLENKNIDTLVDYANKYKQKINLKDNKIVINEPKDIETVYNIAFELFYTSEISNEQRMTNSIVKINQKENKK